MLIEETAEIHLDKPNLLRFEARRAQMPLGQEAPLPAVTIADLLRATLRHRPDRILVGEVRGAEAFDLLQALNTGHLGSLSTIHANSAEQALDAARALRADRERRACRIAASAKPSPWPSTWSFTLHASTAGAALQSFSPFEASMDQPTASSSSLNLCRRSMPAKERSYDQMFAIVAPVDRVVPRSCVRRRNSCADIAVRTAVVPDRNVDRNADHRPRGRAEHVRCGDMDIRTC